MIPRECWWLPRPRKDHYIGSWPLHFGKKLCDYIKIDPIQNREFIINPFGGKAEVGLRCDINEEVKPDFDCDAHNLPSEWSSKFKVVILDPPYSDKYSKDLYNTPKLRPSKYISEAVRVLQPGGLLVHYHYYLAKRPAQCNWHSIIAVITRVYHKARIVSIFTKESATIT